MSASDSVVETAGGAWAASLNHYSTGGNAMVVTQQVDEWVYIVGQDEFSVARCTLAEWLGEIEQSELHVIECFDAEGAWEMLRHLRDGCLVWQCGGCDGWIFTSNRPRVGVLQCSTCGNAGVDFRHADRHVGGRLD